MSTANCRGLGLETPMKKILWLNLSTNKKNRLVNFNQFSNFLGMNSLQICQIFAFDPS